METVDHIDEICCVIPCQPALDMQIAVPLESFLFLRGKRMPQALSIQCLAS